MKIIHISDLHFCAPPDAISAYFDKRIIGSINYFFKRRFQHDLSLLDRAIEFILTEQPDVVVCSGDITSTGQPIEFEMALKSLAPLSGIKFIYIPGNHDAYVKNPRCKNALNSTFAQLNNSTIELNDLPQVITVKGIDFILLNECTPTNIFLSNGHISSDASKNIKKICDKPTKNPRILVGHFPIMKKYSFLKKRRGLSGQNTIQELIRSKKIDLSLCGHMHEESADVDTTGRGELSAASITKSGGFTIIEYDKSENTFSYKFHSI